MPKNLSTVEQEHLNDEIESLIEDATEGMSPSQLTNVLEIVRMELQDWIENIEESEAESLG